MDMRPTGLSWVTVAALAIINSGCSSTEAPKPASSEPLAARPGAVGAGGAGANLTDGEFVRDVALKNMVEVELSRMALDYASERTAAGRPVPKDLGLVTLTSYASERTDA